MVEAARSAAEDYGAGYSCVALLSRSFLTTLNVASLWLELFAFTFISRAQRCLVLFAFALSRVRRWLLFIDSAAGCRTLSPYTSGGDVVEAARSAVEDNLSW